MAIPIALLVMLVTFVLAGVGVAVAIDTNTSSNRDTNSKAAIETADAGVRSAIYRLNMYRPDPNYCPTVPTSAQAGGNGLCAQDGPETLGNGATFTYWVSRVMLTGDKCAGTTVDSSQSNVAQRCITALGTENNVSARVQERVAAYTSKPVFPTAIFGTKSVTISNNVNIASNTAGSPALLGTNGVLNVAPTGGGTTTIDGYQLPPGASLNMGGNVVNNGPTTGIPAPYPVPTAIDPKTTAENTQSPYNLPATYQGGTCKVSSSQVQTNCNYRISRGLLYAGCQLAGQPVPDCDAAAGNITFDPNARTLTLGNNATLTLGGGVYNFCSLTLNNNSSIKIAPGASVSIYIDSPQDPNSGSSGTLPAATNPKCASGTGALTMAQNASLNPGPGGSALSAQIYVYGDPNDTPPTNAVTLSNNSNSSYAIAAPFSNVTLNPSNNSTFVGAIVGYTVTLGNASHFTYEADASSLQSGALQLYYRTFFEQCPATATSPSDPTSGC